jgi:glycosyltransferase involved in cell wall biosynthesis
MTDFAKHDIPCLKHLLIPAPVLAFTEEECAKSENIMIFAGFSGVLWNHTYGKTNALGGSERAVAYLSQCFPKNYKIFVTGDVKEETVNNVTFVNTQNIGALIQSTCFNTIVISRYISFFELYPYYKAKQTFIWTHDTTFHHYGCSLSDCNLLLTKHIEKITGVVCLTDWHKNHISALFPMLSSKISIINNGLELSLFPQQIQKVPNQFIYSSCSERGLKRLLQIWPDVLKMAPDATLRISSYNLFPRSKEETEMWEIIKCHDSIKHVGRLNPAQLYELMASSEYWLYTSYWPETSCITALEMLRSGVICLYYPVAGITETMGGNGIQIKEKEECVELSKVLNMSEEEKKTLVQKGVEYTGRCSWADRCDMWRSLML